MNTPIKKLEDTHKHIVISMLGAGCTVKEIVNELQDQFQLEISERAVYYYKYEHKEAVEKAREKFLAELNIIPISSKIYRQFRRQMLVDDIIDKGLWCEMETASEFKYKKGNHSTVNQILNSAKKESEGDKQDLSFTLKLEKITQDAIDLVEEANTF